MDNISDELVAKMRGNEFSLQLDEGATNTNDKDDNFICYVRFIDNDDNIVEDFLFCKAFQQIAEHMNCMDTEQIFSGK